MILFNLGIPQSEQEQGGSCDFVAIDDEPTPLFDIHYNDNGYNTLRITTFIKTLIEYSGLVFYSRENFIVEALTFLLLNFEVDIRDKFNLLMYQMNNKYVPWGFDAPKDNDVNKINYLDVFKSLINILLRLDVNRKVLQCYHCRTKCSCDVVATNLISELELFTLQDSNEQVVHIEEPLKLTPVMTSPILMNGNSFIIEIPDEHEQHISSNHNIVMHNDSELPIWKGEHNGATPVMTPSTSMKHDSAWKGHNDDGIPIINFDALFGHTPKDHDLDLQRSCKM